MSPQEPEPKAKGDWLGEFYLLLLLVSRREKEGVITITMEQFNNRTIKNSGFTIMELLVSMTVFIMVITAFMGLFISALNEQRRSADRINLLNNGSYAIEYMTRATRMAEKNINLADDTCVADKMNYNQPLGDTSIQFLKTEWDPTALPSGKYVQRCHLFYLQANQIFMKKSSNSGVGGFPVNAEALTPIDILVENLRFAVQGDGQAGPQKHFQPVTTLTIRMKSTGADPQELEFQSSISQRQLDIAY